LSVARGAPTVSLVLGSGGARGYAHIGAIEELLAQGFDIRAISGCSMGALVGGIYAAGKLDEYRDWSRTLQRLDVLRLLDWTFSGGGFIKGDRLIEQIKSLIGEVRIEDLPISYTAVAVDLNLDPHRIPAAPLRGPHPRRRRPAQSGADHPDFARSDRLHDCGRRQRTGRELRRHLLRHSR
jgi:hypothetical protein